MAAGYYKRVNFSKIYSGNLDGAEYCNWFSFFENGNTVSKNNSAYGLYSIDGFSACQQSNAGENNGLLNRYSNDLSVVPLNFVNIKRRSNFLVPVLLGTGTDKMINLTNGTSEDESSALYTINNATGILSNYKFNYQITQSFFTDSLIITDVDTANSKINTFSIFYGIHYDPTVFSSENNNGINIVFNKNIENQFFREIPTSILTSSTYKFYKYGIHFDIHNGDTASLSRYNPSSLDEFLTNVADGIIYVAKEDLLAERDYLKDPIVHPTFINAELKINYWSSLRTSSLQTVNVKLAGRTSSCIAVDGTEDTACRFKTINNENIYKYVAQNFSSIQAINNETYPTANSSSSDFYYPGGVLVGWTTSSTKAFRNGAPILLQDKYYFLSQDTSVQSGKTYYQKDGSSYNKVTQPSGNPSNNQYYEKVSYYSAGDIIGADTYSSFYQNENDDVALFYFSNTKGQSDLSTIDSSFRIKEIKLYPIYAFDENYIPPVIEIKPRKRSTGDNYITLTETGFNTMLSTLKAYPVTKIESTTVNGAPGLKVITGGNTATTFALGNSITFPSATATTSASSVTASYFNITQNGTGYKIPVIPPTLSQILGPGTGTGTGTVDTTKFLRSDATWSNELTGRLILSNELTGYKHTNNTEPTTSNALFRANGNGFFDGNLSANKVFNAVFNDYAEYRTTIDLAPGHVVIDNDNGSLSCSFTRLQPGAQVISDTFGHSMGHTEIAQTPLAVAGRVLAYTYQPRENYHAGMAVCSAPNGTVDIMTREEIRDYPDCIIGIVSEIPQYDTWGSDNVKVDGRIWIKVK